MQKTLQNNKHLVHSSKQKQKKNNHGGFKRDMLCQFDSTISVSNWLQVAAAKQSTAVYKKKSLTHRCTWTASRVSAGETAEYCLT